MSSLFVYAGCMCPYIMRWSHVCMHARARQHAHTLTHNLFHDVQKMVKLLAKVDSMSTMGMGYSSSAAQDAAASRLPGATQVSDNWQRTHACMQMPSRAFFTRANKHIYDTDVYFKGLSLVDGIFDFLFLFSSDWSCPPYRIHPLPLHDRLRPRSKQT